MKEDAETKVQGKCKREKMKGYSSIQNENAHIYVYIDELLVAKSTFMSTKAS